MAKSKSATSSATVYPTGERLMPGVPDVPLTTDGATAERLVVSGAFRHEAPEGATEIEIVELSDAARAALDLFVPPDLAVQPDEPQE